MESAQQHQEILEAFVKKNLERLTQCMKKQFEEARYQVILALLEDKMDA